MLESVISELCIENKLLVDYLLSDLTGSTFGKEWFVLFGTLLGGIISVSITFIQNKFEKSRFDKKIEHDHKMMLSDKDISLRKEIYLDSLEAISTAVNSIAGIANNNPDNNIDLKGEFPVSAYRRVELVAGVEVIKKSNICSEAIIKSIFELSLIKGKLNGLIMERDSNNSLFNQSLEYMKDNTNEMTEARKCKDFNEVLWNNLKENADKFSADMDRCLKKVDDLNSKIEASHLVLVRESAESVKLIEPLVSELVIAMRCELHANDDNDITSIKELISQSNKVGAEEISKFIERLPSLIE